METLSRALGELLPEFASVDNVASVGGGCISETRRVRVTLRSGDVRHWLVKTNAASFLDNFQAEWDGLERLRAAATVVVPQPIAVGQSAGAAWLIMDWIDSSSPGPSFFADFGHGLAQLHQLTSGNRIGLPRDNYLGSAVQINTPCDDWVSFVATHRIGFQLRWATDQGLADMRLKHDVQRIIDTLDRRLEGRDGSTSLIHGDLWSGNYLCSSDRQPVLIDPAVYYGCREAEFGMLKLFGSCPRQFDAAYQHAYPLPAGWQRRVKVYVLYHLLNHLNLFGGGYLGQCRSIAAEILGA